MIFPNNRVCRISAPEFIRTPSPNSSVQGSSSGSLADTLNDEHLSRKGFHSFLPRSSPIRERRKLRGPLS